MENTVVVGGSIAGLSTAYHLARKGFNVTVVEEHEEIGKPVQCAGLISKSGAKDFVTDLEKVALNKIRGARIHSPYNNEITIKKDDFVAYVVDRAAMDKTTAEMAMAEGAKMFLCTRVMSKRKSNLFLKSKHRGEVVKTDFVIGADGPNSTIRELMDIKINKENFIHAYQARVQGEFEKDFVDLYFGEFAKGFFAWVIPENEEFARVGIGCNLGINPQNSFERFLHKEGFDGKIIDELSGLIPCGEPLKGIVKENMLLVGDAAFHTKASTGGGCVMASRAAKILADAIDAHVNKGNPLADYEKNLSQIYKELELHWKIHRFIHSMNDEKLDDFFKKMRESGMAEILELYGDMDNPSSFIKKLVNGTKMLKLAPEAVKFKMT